MLYPDYLHSRFHLDPFAPNMTAHPEYAHASPLHHVLKAGQIMFIPAGCAHVVRNIGHTLAISYNYVDKTNLEYALTQYPLSRPVSCTHAEQCTQPARIFTLNLQTVWWYFYC